MKTEVRTFLINVLEGFPKVKLRIEPMRMKHDPKNNPKSGSSSSADQNFSTKEAISKSSLPSVPISAATNAKGKPIALMMASQLSSIPFLGDGFGFKEAGKDCFILHE